MEILFGSDIPGRYKNDDDLWLPYGSSAEEGDYSGIVPYPYLGITGDTGSQVGTTALVEYSLDGDDVRLEDGNDVDFFFRITNIPAPLTTILSARITDDTSSTWYRNVRPWTWLSRDIVTQAGNVTILNNIINPNRNEQTSLHYVLNRSGTVTIQVFDLAGGLVEILQRGYQDEGEYSVSWNGRNRSGRVVARGIYFIRFVGPGGIDQIRKVLVVK